MNCSRGVHLVAFLLLAMVLSAGCFMETGRAPDEQKEPHYLTGVSRAKSYDYAGAVQAFRSALEANPNSSSAHEELGLLLAEKEQVLDYAEAIYHLQTYLRLQTNAHNADMVREKIMVCKQGLTREVPLGPVTQQVQREIMKLTAENAHLTNDLAVLKQERDQLRLYVAQLSQRLAQIPTNASPPVPPTLPPSFQPTNRTAPAVGGTPVPSPGTGLAPGPGATPLGGRTPLVAPPATNSVSSPTNRPSGSLRGPAARIIGQPAKMQPAPSTNNPSAGKSRPTPSGRAYTVRSGDTLATIAKRHGVKLPDLVAANPGLNPNKLRPNQTIIIPSR